MLAVCARMCVCVCVCVVLCFVETSVRCWRVACALGVASAGQWARDVTAQHQHSTAEPRGPVTRTHNTQHTQHTTQHTQARQNTHTRRHLPPASVALPPLRLSHGWGRCAAASPARPLLPAPARARSAGAHRTPGMIQTTVLTRLLVFPCSAPLVRGGCFPRAPLPLLPPPSSLLPSRPVPSRPGDCPRPPRTEPATSADGQEQHGAEDATP
jgi:hypothetical protein